MKNDPFDKFKSVNTYMTGVLACRIKEIEDEIASLSKAIIDAKAAKAENEAKYGRLKKQEETRHGDALFAIESKKRDYERAINENNAVIDDLHSMIEMIPEKKRSKFYNPDALSSQPVYTEYFTGLMQNTIQLFSNIMTDTFSSAVSRFFKKDGHYKYDDMVRDFLQNCVKAELHLRGEIEEMKADIDSDISELLQIEENRHNSEKQKNRELKIALQSNLEILEKAEKGEIERVFSAEAFSKFQKNLEFALNNIGLLEPEWKECELAVIRRSQTMIGNIFFPCSVETEDAARYMKQRIPQYDFSGNFLIPYILDTQESPLRLLFKESHETKKRVCEQIQLIILRMRRLAPPDSFDIHFVDPEGRGKNLGIFNATEEENAKISVYTHNSREEIRELFKKLEKETDEVSRLIGSCKSFAEYIFALSTDDEPLKERVLVLFDYPNGLAEDELSILNILVNNAHRSGLHVIIATEHNLASGLHKSYDTELGFANESTWHVIDARNQITGKTTLRIPAKDQTTKVGGETLGRVRKIERKQDNKFEIWLELCDGAVANICSYTNYGSSNERELSFKIKRNEIGVGDYLFVRLTDEGKDSAVLQRFNVKKYFIGSYVSNPSMAELEVEGVYRFQPEFIAPFHRDFLAKYRAACEQETEVENGFSDWFDTDDVDSYCDGTDGLRLPVMVRSGRSGGICDLTIGTGTSTHTLITGNTSSGKSTFLHMIISSIITRYHPDDVELWLVDYGKVEFNEYYQNTPPHVRFISLEKSAEFTYSFLDYLHDFFSRREKLFEAEGVTSLQGYRKKHGKHSMPRVVLIIDEFHNMTQHVQQNIDYRQILENALAEYRKFGFSCIFSNQTVSGLQGLTDTAKLQIKNRVALSNEILEMKETLRVGNDNYTDEMLHKMERTAVGELWYKEWTSVSDFSINQFKGIYINEAERAVLLSNVCDLKISVANDTEVKKINSSERKPIPLNEVCEWARKSEESRKFVLTLGSPATVEKTFSFSVDHRYNHNILLAGRNLSLKKDIIAATLWNVYAMEDFDIIVYADDRDELFESLEERLTLKKNGDRVRVYTKISDICYSINKLTESILRKETQRKTLVLWFGLPDLFDEFNVSPRKANVDFGEDVGKENPDEIFIPNIEALENDEILIEEAKNLGISVREMLYNISGEIQPSVIRENDYSYNACEDVLKIITNGGKFYVHSFIPLDGAYDFRRTKGLNSDNFIHKIVLNLPKEDLFDLGIRYNGIELEEGVAALYTDGSKAKKFRPYEIDREE